MVLIFSHNNRSLVANWWWTVDKTLLACISILIVRQPRGGNADRL